MTPTPQHQQTSKPAGADIHAAVNKVEKREGDATIREQPGCGPSVTDYPGLSDKPAGDDAQATGSDA